ncbi:MAG: hypothetical protein HWD59_01020 [Coxiellaceae bacterium]|nr:MAG: hypothetical protein HWD59_01020 [Coxiellaceae bacterium]
MTILSPDHNNISCQQSSATNILTAPLALPPNMTPVLTSQYISERIFGPAKACNQVTYITETLLQSSLEVSEYVEMVYRQILDFKIIVLTEDQIGSELERFINIQKPACYFASTHTMYILNTALQTLSFAKNLDFIRHEFKHAATNAALSILSGGKYQTSHFCYYPLNDIQKEYVKACIKAGDKNVFELKTTYLRDIRQARFRNKISFTRFALSAAR